MTLVPANLANTTLADGSAFGPTGPSTNSGAADNQWHLDSRFGNAGAVFTANELGAENAPALRTTLSGLAEGTYDCYVFFWSRPGEDWRIRAGFSTAEMLVIRRYSSQQCETNQLGTPANVLTNDVALYRAYVGRKVVTAGSALSVYVDDFDGAAVPGSQRTAYQGLGVARVLPILNIGPGQSFAMTNGTLTCAGLNNEGVLTAATGALIVTGNVTNTGDLRLSGQASLSVAGTLSNRGLLDVINWDGTLPAGLLNTGIVLDRSTLELSIVSIGPGIRMTIPGYAGHTYQLQTASTLPCAPADWQNLGGLVFGTGEHGIPVPIQYEPTNALAAPFGYYRVSVAAE